MNNRHGRDLILAIRTPKLLKVQGSKSTTYNRNEMKE